MFVDIMYNICQNVLKVKVNFVSLKERIEGKEYRLNLTYLRLNNVVRAVLTFPSKAGEVRGRNPLGVISGCVSLRAAQ